jgi:antitoxin (DNA-binding transcriptional repressor) of toxin-antitoxin stability system
MESTLTITAREAAHRFAHYTALAASGKEILIKRRGGASVKLVPAEPKAEMSSEEREALIQKALSFRALKPYGKKFERSDAYDE